MRKRNWARLIAKDWKDDPELCTECGSKLEVLSAFAARQLASKSSPAQDDVIEKILRCRGEWLRPSFHEKANVSSMEPWFLSTRGGAREPRGRSPRGPPRQLDMFKDRESQVPTWNPEDENQDPPGDDWMLT